MGKPLTAAKSDVEDARNISNYFCGLMELAGGQASTNSADHLNLMIRQPFGVVAAIIPWNFPLNIVSPPKYFFDSITEDCVSFVMR